MSTYGSFPNKFSQLDLQDLGKGENKINESGCIYSSHPWECTKGSLGYSIFPENGEYTNGPLMPSNCYTCSWTNGYGSEYHVISGNGPTYDCSGGFAISGGGKCSVERIAYLGDPASCCLLSKSGSGTQNSKLTGNPNPRPVITPWPTIAGTTYTCDPDVIDNCDSTYAQDVAKLCSSFQWKDTKRAWNQGDPKNPLDTTGYCANFVNTIGTKQAAQTVLLPAVNYMASNITDFGMSDPMNAQLVNNLITTCETGPAAGICDKALNSMCLNNIDGTPRTRQDVFNAYNKYLTIMNDPNIKDKSTALPYKNIYTACGCHLSAAQYAEWNKLGVDESNYSCDPLCMLPGVARQFQNNIQESCDQNLCIIDNVSIDIVNSQTGDINFSTVCGNCGSGGSGSCRCVFSDINIFQSGSSTGNLNFQQNCGGNCQMPDPNNPGNFIQIDCNTGLPIGGGGGNNNNNSWNNIKKWINSHTTIIVLIIVIAVVIGVWILWKWGDTSVKRRKGLADTITLDDLFGGIGGFQNYV